MSCICKQKMVIIRNAKVFCFVFLQWKDICLLQENKKFQANFWSLHRFNKRFQSRLFKCTCTDPSPICFRKWHLSLAQVISHVVWQAGKSQKYHRRISDTRVYSVQFSHIHTHMHSHKADMRAHIETPTLAHQKRTIKTVSTSWNIGRPTAQRP